MQNTQIEITDEMLHQLRNVSVPTVTAMLEAKFRNTYLIGIEPKALQPGQIMVGRARTLRFIPKRETILEAQYATSENRPHRQVIEDIQPGDVLVIETGGCLGAAVVGDMFTRRVKERDGQGIVIDGVVRDMSAIRTVGLPLYCKGMHGSGIGRELMAVDYDRPISVAGVPVFKGDVILGDEDGVVVIPPEGVAELIEHGIEHDVQERWIRQKLAEGYPLHRVYPPDAEMEKEYRAWRKAQG
ncbi:MAG: hypothetical protein HY710_07725 [Candidatus Latescibacteria bacterium]|nr:hypothetical protein [Candidatus Latescibacterota bacterium]